MLLNKTADDILPIFKDVNKLTFTKIKVPLINSENFNTKFSSTLLYKYK